MEQTMLGRPGEDLLGLVLDFTTQLHDGSLTAETAKRFLRKTIFSLTLGDGQTREKLLAAINYVADVARAFVTSKEFRMASAREDVDLELIDGDEFDHDPSSEEVYTVLTKRGLEEPTEEDALRYGAMCLEGKDKRPVVFLHKKNLWRGPNGNRNVLVFRWNGSRRDLHCSHLARKWSRHSRFAGRRLYM